MVRREKPGVMADVTAFIWWWTIQLLCGFSSTSQHRHQLQRKLQWEERECCAWCLIYSPRSRAWTWESAALRQSATILGMLKGQLTLGDTRWHEDTMPPPWSNLIWFLSHRRAAGCHCLSWGSLHDCDMMTWWRVAPRSTIKLNNYHLTATATKYWIGLIIRIKIIFFDLTFWQALMATMASPIFVLCIIKWNIYWAQMYDMSVSYLLIHLE